MVHLFCSPLPPPSLHPSPLTLLCLNRQGWLSSIYAPGVDCNQHHRLDGLLSGDELCRRLPSQGRELTSSLTLPSSLSLTHTHLSHTHTPLSLCRSRQRRKPSPCSCMPCGVSICAHSTRPSSLCSQSSWRFFVFLSLISLNQLS
jgi:hypothetical protein